MTREEFARIARSGALSHSAHLSVRKVAAGTRRGFSVVISKKVARTAPARNRARRRVYDALTRSSAAAQCSAIVYVKKGGTALDFSHLASELSAHFR